MQFIKQWPTVCDQVDKVRREVVSINDGIWRNYAAGSYQGFRAIMEVEKSHLPIITGFYGRGEGWNTCDR